jgi:hypothetical protein
VRSSQTEAAGKQLALDRPQPARQTTSNGRTRPRPHSYRLEPRVPRRPEVGYERPLDDLAVSCEMDVQIQRPASGKLAHDEGVDTTVGARSATEAVPRMDDAVAGWTPPVCDLSLEPDRRTRTSFRESTMAYTPAERRS